MTVFDYTDYRKYLFDFYQREKRKSKSFSYRSFAKKIGINSVGFYKDIVENRQHLGMSAIVKFSKGMGHTKKEAEYFKNMVCFSDAKTVENRAAFYAKMLAGKDPKVKIVEESKFEYYSKWYYSAVRGLISYGSFKDSPDDYKKIAKTLKPQIRPDQARKAVGILEKLGFVWKNEKGFFIITDGAVTTGTIKPDKNVAALNVVNFQKDVIKLAGEAFDRFPSSQSNMSTLTLSVSFATFNAIKEELAALRGKIAAMAHAEPAANSVYQFNMQLFPMTDIHE
jgi:uncharacterized protein (TIGR02147 family)